MTIKIPLGFLLSIIFGLIGAGLVFAAAFSRESRFWLIDQYVGGPHHDVIRELLPPTPSEHFLLWLGLGTMAIAAIVALVTLASKLRSTPQSASVSGVS
ncbi:hypothetical protein [Agromyces bauzanensis]